MDIDLLISAVLLFTGAVIVLFSELFIPAHGLLAVLCGLLAVAGVAVCFAMGTEAGFLATVATIVLGPVVLTLMVKLYPSSPVGKRVLLQPPPPDTADGLARETADLAQLLGRRGRAATILRPAGICEFDGRRVDCLSESQVIAGGSAVEVIRVDGPQVYVRLVPPDSAA